MNQKTKRHDFANSYSKSSFSSDRMTFGRILMWRWRWRWNGFFIITATIKDRKISSLLFNLRWLRFLLYFLIKRHNFVRDCPAISLRKLSTLAQQYWIKKLTKLQKQTDINKNICPPTKTIKRKNHIDKAIVKVHTNEGSSHSWLFWYCRIKQTDVNKNIYTPNKNH